MTAIADAYGVAGFNNRRHLGSLGAFVSQVPEGSRVLEIGAGFGGTTWQILDSLPAGCEFHSCDTFQMNGPGEKKRHITGILGKHGDNAAIVEQMRLYAEHGQRAAFDWAIGQHPRRHMLQAVHECRSVDLLTTDRNWACVYIDGFHSYENVSAELAALRDVPYLCGDDYHPMHQGCVRAIDEFIAQTGRPLWHDTPESGSGFWSSIAP